MIGDLATENLTLESLALNLTYLKAGDLQPWHYDQNEFTVTLLLQAPEAGGELE